MGEYRLEKETDYRLEPEQELRFEVENDEKVSERLWQSTAIGGLE